MGARADVFPKQLFKIRIEIMNRAKTKTIKTQSVDTNISSDKYLLINRKGEFETSAHAGAKIVSFCQNLVSNYTCARGLGYETAKCKMLVLFPMHQNTAIKSTTTGHCDATEKDMNNGLDHNSIRKLLEKEKENCSRAFLQ